MNVRTLRWFVAALVIAGLIFWLRPHRTASPTRPVAADTSNSNLTRSALLPRHPTPPLPVMVTPEETNTVNPAVASLLQRLLKGEQPPKLTLQQVEGYLRDNHRSAESLLGAFHVTDDKTLLKEAEEKFPHDPQVDFVAASQKDISPEERRQWLDAFKQSAPDRALPDFLSASDYFKSGQTDLALQEVQAGAGKPLQNYQLDFLQGAEEAYLAAGYSPAEAKTIASFDLLLPELAEYKNVGVNLVNLSKSYQQAGDTASAQASLQLAMDLGQRLNDAGSLTMVQMLVGMNIERTALGAMDPNTVYGANNQTVQSQLDAIEQQREFLKSLNKQGDYFMPQMPDQDIVNFWNRLWQFGAASANQWAVNKYGWQQ